MGYRIWRKSGPILPIKGKRGFFDTSYGKSEVQELDIWPPEEEGPSPVIINIHGGSFVAYGKRQKGMTTLMLEGLEKGLAVAVLNYRLADEAVFPEPVKDIRRTIRFLKANAPIYRLEPDQTAAWGGSAGGYMALMTCLFADNPYYDQELNPNLHVSAQVAGGVTWYPLTDMASCGEKLAISSVVSRYFRKEVTDVCVECKPVVPVTLEPELPLYNRERWPTRFLGYLVGSGDETVRKASPFYAIRDCMPPVLIQHRNGDEVVPMQQSIRFALYAGTCCGKERITVEILPNAVHSSVLFEAKENLKWVFAFIPDILEIRESVTERQGGGKGFTYFEF